jgi:hypothetical protein
MNARRDSTAYLRFDGYIMGASFASGDRIVAGRWHDAPLGPFADVMWCDPDGRRVLFAPTDRVLAFVGSHYSFHELVVTPVRVERGDGAVGTIVAEAGPVTLRLSPAPRGVASLLLSLRPRAVRTRPAWITLEDTLARPIVGPLFGADRVHARGRTRTGAREWYAIHDFRDARASASVHGRDPGPVGPCAPAGFGFSEFPSRPAIVRVTSIIEAVRPAPTRPLRGYGDGLGDDGGDGDIPGR